MYTATYQTTVSGGSLPANGDPRDAGVLDLAKQIAQRHWEANRSPNVSFVMVRLEFDGETIWTHDKGWILCESHGDG